MEEFVIKNPRWDVIGKYISIIPLKCIVETGWFVHGRSFSITELNALAQKHLPAVIRLLKTYKILRELHLADNIPQYADDIIIIYLLILIEFKTQDRQSIFGAIEEDKAIGLFYKKFGTIIEAIERYKREYSDIFEGYHFKLVQDKNTGDKLKFDSLTLPPQFNQGFLDELKSTYYRNRDRITPIFAQNEYSPDVVKKSKIVSFFEYLDAELPLKKYQCADFISFFSKQIDLPIGRINSDNVKQTVRRYKALQKKDK